MKKKVQVYGTIDLAIDKTIQECIDEGVLKDMLLEHRSEVKDVLLTEYDEEKVRKMFADDAREEGRIAGITEMSVQYYIEGYVPLNKALENSGLSKEDFLREVEEYKERKKHVFQKAKETGTNI